MRRIAIFLTLAVFLLLVVVALRQAQDVALVHAQEGDSASALLPSTTLGTGSTGYDLSWWTLDGGGGTLGGGAGQYTLSGTAGQPDAGVLSDGYTLVGGFWGGGTAPEYCIYLPLVFKNH